MYNVCGGDVKLPTKYIINTNFLFEKIICDSENVS